MYLICRQFSDNCRVSQKQGFKIPCIFSALNEKNHDDDLYFVFVGLTEWHGSQAGTEGLKVANKKSWSGGSINFLYIKVSFEKYSPLGAAAGWQWQRPALGATPGDQGRGQPPLFNFVQNTHFIFNEIQKALQFNILKAPMLHPFPHIQHIHMWKLSL